MSGSVDKLKVLLAEDTAVGRKVVAQMLTEAGYQVTAVADGQAVLELLSGSLFDVVVMDCMMPGMDGFQASRAIRSGDAGEEKSAIPIVALTGLASEADRQQCIDAGMDDYVQKPVDQDGLLSAMRQALKRKAEDLELAAQQALQQEEQSLLESLDAWSPGFMDTIIEQFLEDVPGDIGALKSALEQEDMTRLRGLAHRLRGSADVLSARTLSQRAVALERACAAGNLALVRQLAPALILELERMLQAHEVED